MLLWYLICSICSEVVYVNLDGDRFAYAFLNALNTMMNMSFRVVEIAMQDHCLFLNSNSWNLSWDWAWAHFQSIHSISVSGRSSTCLKIGCGPVHRFKAVRAFAGELACMSGIGFWPPKAYCKLSISKKSCLVVFSCCDLWPGVNRTFASRIWPGLLLNSCCCFWLVPWLCLLSANLVLLLFIWFCCCLLIWYLCYSVVADPGLSQLWQCFLHLQIPVLQLCATILNKFHVEHLSSIQTAFWPSTVPEPTAGTPSPATPYHQLQGVLERRCKGQLRSGTAW